MASELTLSISSALNTPLANIDVGQRVCEERATSQFRHPTSHASGVVSSHQCPASNNTTRPTMTLVTSIAKIIHASHISQHQSKA